MNWRHGGGREKLEGRRMGSRQEVSEEVPKGHGVWERVWMRTDVWSGVWVLH